MLRGDKIDGQPKCKLSELPAANVISNATLFYVVTNGQSLAVNAATLAGYIIDSINS